MTTISSAISKLPRKLILPCLCAILFSLPGELYARKVRLSHKATAQTSQSSQRENYKNRPTIVSDSAQLDSLRTLIRMAGFEKNASSAVETIFVTNHSDVNISAITLTLTYRDLSGRMLHKRTETIRVDIPAGETRMISIPAFERQRSLYYYKSKPPRKGGMPFEVDTYIDSLEFKSY